jgi:prepilin peptidase CpaA
MSDFAYALTSEASVTAFGLLVYAALHDLGVRTIPNTVSLALAICGLVLHLHAGDLGQALLGAVAVFLLALAAWWVHALGGGDVKLFGATALMLPLSAVPLFLLSTSLWGGVLALGFLALRPFMNARHGARPATLPGRMLRAEAWRIRRRGPLPYAVAIAAGGATSLLAG